jgi:hypothetical protein
MYNKAHTNNGTIVIRPAAVGDAAELIRLAQLDSTHLPAAPLLAAFAGERALAAISLGDGRAVADPFSRTAEVVAMLEARRDQIRGPGRARRLRRRILGAGAPSPAR